MRFSYGQSLLNMSFPIFQHKQKMQEHCVFVIIESRQTTKQRNQRPKDKHYGNVHNRLWTFFGKRVMYPYFQGFAQCPTQNMNEIIFEAEKERNTLEFERDDLKGLARFTKNGELQSKIDRKNEEIDLLKMGLSEIVKRYVYQNVQEFYRTYHKPYRAYITYNKQVTEWEKTYSEKTVYRQELPNKMIKGRDNSSLLNINID